MKIPLFRRNPILPKSSLPELNVYFQELQLRFPQEHYEPLATQAAEQDWTHVEYLARLLEGECHRRRENRIQRRIQAAHFPGCGRRRESSCFRRCRRSHLIQALSFMR